MKMMNMTEEKNRWTRLKLWVAGRKSVFLVLLGVCAIYACEEEESERSEDCSERVVAEDIARQMREIIGEGNRMQAFAFKPNSIQTTESVSATSGIGAEVLSAYPHNTYEEVNYIGAVDPSQATPWYAKDDWSFYAHIVRGIPDKVRPQGNVVEVRDADLRSAMQANSHRVTWTPSNTYILVGLVFVQEGETLHIEAGTVIKGRDVPAPGSSLIVARGGKIMAEGTSQRPIIFTFEADPLDGSTPPTTRGRWGGLVVLGRSELNSTPGVSAIEGVPTTETRGLYGGGDRIDHADNSGVLRYVSVRHGGTEVQPGDELNGITLGAVGSETQINYVEVVGNKDDGIEWCGGTATSKHLISAYCADDGLDYNEGYRGFSQFIILHQDPVTGQNGGEHDGGLRPITGTPYSIPLFVNMTSRGSGGSGAGTNQLSQAMTLRANSGGRFYHSLFIDYPRGVSIEHIPCAEEDSWNRVQQGELFFVENVFYQVGDAREALDVFYINIPE